MQENPTPVPADDGDGQIEQAILLLLLVGDVQRPWSVEEIEREIDDATVTQDSLRRLHADGLVHRCGDFVWATRAALRADEIAL